MGILRFHRCVWLTLIICCFAPRCYAEALLPQERKTIADLVERLKQPDYRLDDSLSSLGERLVGEGRLFSAEMLYKHAIETLDYKPLDYLQFVRPPFWVSPGRMSNQIIQVLEVAYPELIRVLIAEGKHNEALEYAERGRSKLLQAVLQRKSGKTEHFPLINVAQIRALANETQSTFVIYAVIAQSPRHRVVHKTKSEKVELISWVVQSNGNIHFESLPVGALAFDTQDTINDPFGQAANAFTRTLPRGVLDRVSITAPHLKMRLMDQETHLKRLYRTLLAPLAHYLPRTPEENVVIIPDGGLFLVPFNAMKDADGRYVIERHSISLMPSLGIYALLEDRAKQARSVDWARAKSVVVGDPKMPSLPSGFELAGTLPQLSGARDEARSIATLLHAQPIIGDQALENVISKRMEKTEVIHLATHGLLTNASELTISGLTSGSASRDLLPGAIVLGANPDEEPVEYPGHEQWGLKSTYNGFLTSGKILMLKLDAELVTLSACDTARGWTYEGQFVGLPTALIAAGARSVVLTLWSIPDAPTAELMVDFYKSLIAGHSKAVAIRRAILKTKARHPNPQNWAAFTLIGLPR